MTPAINILYHNPSMTRPGRWPGERGRQLVEAMELSGSPVRSMPPVSPTTGPRPGSALKALIKSRMPRSWRGPLITLRLLERGTVNTVRWSWRLVRDLRRSPPDVIVARYFEFEWTPLIVARLLRRPLVLETHSPFGLEGALRHQRPSRLAGWMDRVFFRQADRIWVHTPALRDLVAELTDDPAKIHVIPFGVEDPGVVADPARSTDTVEIAFAGSFYPWHGVDELMTAYAQLRDEVPDVHLTIIGDGLTMADCESRAQELGIAEAVSFPGWLDRAALYQSLQRSHIGVAPYLEMQYNYFEPVKILDYQMAGLPVVASAVGEVPSMVDDGESGMLVPPGDVGALSSALAKLALDPQMRGEMGRAARRRARRIVETARKVTAVCNELVRAP